MLGFWKSKFTDDYMVPARGLSEEQIKFLRSLKPGDRLILWKNKKVKETHPDLSLKVYNPEHKKEDNEDSI